MQTEPTHQESEPTGGRYILPSWMRIAAPIVATSAAVATAYSRIQNDFYTKIKHEFGVRELSKLRYKAKDAIQELQADGADSAQFDKAKKVINDLYANDIRDGHLLWERMKAFKETALAEIDAMQASKKAGMFQPSDARKAIVRIEDIYTKHADAWIEETGYTSKGLDYIFRGTCQRFRHLGSDTRFSILFTAAISAGASLLGFFMLRKSNELQHELGNLHHRIDAVSALTTPVVSEAPSNDNAPRPKVETRGLKHEAQPLVVHGQER